LDIEHKLIKEAIYITLMQRLGCPTSGKKMIDRIIIYIPLYYFVG
jgi:hypothetical protein